VQYKRNENSKNAHVFLSQREINRSISNKQVNNKYTYNFDLINT